MILDDKFFRLYNWSPVSLVLKFWAYKWTPISLLHLFFLSLCYFAANKGMRKKKRIIAIDIYVTATIISCRSFVQAVDKH